MGTGFLRRLLSTTPGLTHQSLHTAKAKGYVYVLPAEWRMGSELSARRSLPYQPTHTPHHTTHRVQNYRRPAEYTTLDWSFERQRPLNFQSQCSSIRIETDQRQTVRDSHLQKAPSSFCRNVHLDCGRRPSFSSTRKRRDWVKIIETRGWWWKIPLPFYLLYSLDSFLILFEKRNNSSRGWGSPLCVSRSKRDEGECTHRPLGPSSKCLDVLRDILSTLFFKGKTEMRPKSNKEWLSPPTTIENHHYILSKDINCVLIQRKPGFWLVFMVAATTRLRKLLTNWLTMYTQRFAVNHDVGNQYTDSKIWGRHTCPIA